MTLLRLWGVSSAIAVAVTLASPAAVQAQAVQNPYLVTSSTYGAKCDGKSITVSAGSASYSITASGYTFQSTDMNKNIGIIGAGPSGQQFATTIATVSGSTATLNAQVVTGVSGAIAVFGTDDSLAFKNAVVAASNSGGGTLIVPAATCIIGNAAGNTGIPWASEVSMKGQGQLISTLVWISPMDMAGGIVYAFATPPAPPSGRR